MDWITIGLSLTLLGGIVLLIFALREILTSPALTDTVRLLWVLVVLVAPILGALLWFSFGRRRAGSLDRR